MRRYLIERAVSRLPEDQRERYAQEWEADLAQLSRFRGVLWALGLPRAATRLAKTFNHRRRAVLPQVALDALVLAGAYVLAYRLRFGSTMPSRYHDLLWETLPFATVAGLVVLVAFRAYRAIGLLHICLAVIVTTMALDSYAGIVKPETVVAPAGDVPLMLPSSVLVLFMLVAAPALLLTRIRASARA